MGQEGREEEVDDSLSCNREEIVKAGFVGVK